MTTKQEIDIKKQIDDAIERVCKTLTPTDDVLLIQTPAEYSVSMFLDDLKQLQADVAEIKRLLLAPNSKFIEVAIKAETVRNKLGIIADNAKKIELRSNE